MSAVRSFSLYLLVLVVGSLVILAVADWEQAPVGLLGAVIGLSMGAAFLVGQHTERKSS